MQSDEKASITRYLKINVLYIYISPLTSLHSLPRQRHASLHMSDSYRILRKLRFATWGTRYFPTIGFFSFVPFCLLFQMPILVQFLPFFWLFSLTILFQHFPVIYFAFLFLIFILKDDISSFPFFSLLSLSFLLINSFTHLFILFITYFVFV